VPQLVPKSAVSLGASAAASSMPLARPLAAAPVRPAPAAAALLPKNALAAPHKPIPPACVTRQASVMIGLRDQAGFRDDCIPFHLVQCLGPLASRLPLSIPFSQRLHKRIVRLLRFRDVGRVEPNFHVFHMVLRRHPGKPVVLVEVNIVTQRDFSVMAYILVFPYYVGTSGRWNPCDRRGAADRARGVLRRIALCRRLTRVLLSAGFHNVR